MRVCVRARSASLVFVIFMCVCVCLLKCWWLSDFKFSRFALAHYVRFGVYVDAAVTWYLFRGVMSRFPLLGSRYICIPILENTFLDSAIDTRCLQALSDCKSEIQSILVLPFDRVHSNLNCGFTLCTSWQNLWNLQNFSSLHKRSSLHKSFSEFQWKTLKKISF